MAYFSEWSYQQGEELVNEDSSQGGLQTCSRGVKDDTHSRGASLSTCRDVQISWTIGLADLDAKSLKDVYDNATVSLAVLLDLNTVMNRFWHFLYKQF